MTGSDVIALAFGAMIGWGWVVLTGPMIAQAGSIGVLVALLVGGGVSALVGMVYAELTAALPFAGGTVGFVLHGLGQGPAWVCGWSLALAYLSVSLFEAVALPSALSYVVGGLERFPLWHVAGQPVHAPWALIGAAASVVVSWFNYVGVKPAAAFQKMTVLALAVIGLVFVAGSLPSGSPENLAPAFTNVQGLVTAVLLTPFLFVGFDVVPQTAAETKVPARHLGRLMVLSVALAIAWYVAIFAAVSWVLPAGLREAAKLTTADAMVRAFASSLAGPVLVAGGVAGILSSWNAFFLGATRLVFSMAKAGMLPSYLASVHPRYGTPANAVLALGFLNALAPLVGRQALVWFANAGSLAVVTAYLLVTVSFVRLRSLQPGLERPYRAPGGVLLGWVAGGCAAFLALLYLPGSPSGLTSPFEWGIAGAWIAGGGVLYACNRRLQRGATAVSCGLPGQRP